MVHFKLKLDRTSIEHRRPSINVRSLLPEWPEWFQKYHKCLFYPSRTANGIALSNQHRKVKICQSMPRFSRYTRSTYGVRKTTSATQMDVRTWIKCHPRPDKWSSEYTKNAWTLQWRHKEAMASQMTVFPLNAQRLVRLQLKGNIKAPRHWTLYREFTCDQWIPRTKGQ